MKTRLACFLLALAWIINADLALAETTLPNLNDLPSDLVVPGVSAGEPKSGARVWQTCPAFKEGKAAHALYLPTDWRPGKTYPVLCEFPGNGPFKNALGDACDGTVASCRLGYGLSGGQGMIWVSLPCVEPKTGEHALRWWGDADESARYCREAVALVCAKYGGDSRRLVLVGFSRGAIACNYIGLRDDATARLWRAFLAHSHYDGVQAWSYAGSDAEAARRRLLRLGERPQFISHEQSTRAVADYLRGTRSSGAFTVATLPFANHTADWVLKDIPLRAQARAWLAQALKD